MEDALTTPVPADENAPFGDLTPLLAPRSVAVIGASDREGNLGGLAVGFLQKFRYRGEVWPVNAGRSTVAGLRCFANLAALPSVPDLAVIAVPADAVATVAQECIDAGIPAAVVWAGGYAEVGEDGRARQHELEEVCRGRLRLCGPNCIGVINTALGMTASFSALLTEIDHLTAGSISMVSQSGGIAVTSHARAQELGHGFRLTISCGNEAVLTIADFMQALACDDGTRVIMVYTEGVADPAAFVAALAEARRREKPVVVLKGGATAQSGRAALAHTGKLAGSDRVFDAIFREFAAIRVQSQEEMLEVALQLASLPPGRLPRGNRVLLSSFGGGSGVIATDQCAREGLAVPPLEEATREKLKSLLSPLASTLNPVDLTPGSMTNPQNRERLPAALDVLAKAPGVDQLLCFAAGMGALAPAFAEMFVALRAQSDRPVGLSWQSPPAGISKRLTADGVVLFTEHSRLIRAAGHLARYAADMQHRIRVVPQGRTAFPWHEFVGDGVTVVTEDVSARILERAGLPVAHGRLARTADAAARAAEELGGRLAMKAISPAITHRAAAGLVALDVAPEAVAHTFETFALRAAERNARLDGVWLQQMFDGKTELLVSAFRDAQFGVIVGCGMGGGLTEIFDDVVFTRAPIDADGASDLLQRLRTLRRLPELLTGQQRRQVARFLADFSSLAATAPWKSFTFEINPLKVGETSVAAVDGLMVLH